MVNIIVTAPLRPNQTRLLEIISINFPEVENRQNLQLGCRCVKFSLSSLRANSYGQSEYEERVFKDAINLHFLYKLFSQLNTFSE